MFLGLGAAAIVLALGYGGLLETAELKLYDWRLRRAADPASVNPDIVLVEIDGSTIHDLEPLYGHWPWPRVALSVVIDYLHRAPAKVVAVDLTLAERDRVAQYQIGDVKWSGKESDQALADSVKTSGNVVMLADAVDEGSHRRGAVGTDVGGPRVSPRRSCRVPAARAAAVPGARRRHRRRSGTTSSPSTRTVPRAAWRRSSGRGSRPCRRSASPRR